MTYDHTVPFTTRAPRDGEENGKQYNFVSTEEFLKLQKEGRFVEWGERSGVYYGTPVQEAAPATSTFVRKPSRATKALKKVRRCACACACSEAVRHGL